MPSSVFGAASPSNRINVGAIGTGRISRGHDLPGIWKHDSARIMAVCDLDSKRVDEAKLLLNGQYGKQTGKPYDGVTGYANYRELLANRDIDAVVISTPDHWHAMIAIDAVQAGKDVYLQKPASLTIAEGRALSDAVHRSGRIFQIGSQQRSWPQGQFRRACELVRNGRIGELKTVEVGLPGDPSGPEEPVMPVPKNLNYDMWLGSTPVVPYTENRVHPQEGYGRPGWLRCEQFGAGMITGLGRASRRHRALGHGHRVHRADRGLGIGGVPEERAVGRARGLQDRSGVRQRRQDDRQRRLSERHQVHRHRGLGLRLARQRGRDVERSGGKAVRAAAGRERSEDPRLGHRAGRDSPAREHRSPRQLARVHQVAAADRSRRSKSAIAPARACLLHHIAMRAKRKLYWDPLKERFKNDDAANALLSRPQRWPYALST